MPGINNVMSDKTLYTIGVTAGSIIGGYIPSFFGVDGFSFMSLFCSFLGAVAGIWIVYRFIH